MYRGRLKNDLDDWTKRGLIDAETARRLLDDVDSRGNRFSIGTILSMFAAVLIAASILMLVAANWEAIPRLARVVGILGLIWIFHGAALAARAYGADRIAAASLVLGAATFGGAIALIGQLYHLSGDTFAAMFLWFIVTAVSAALFRSGALAVVAGALSLVAFGGGFDSFGWEVGGHGLWAWWPPFGAVAIFALAHWTGASRAKHFGYLLLLAWIWWVAIIDEDITWAFSIALCASAVFFLLTLPRSPLASLHRRLGASASFYALIMAFSAFSFVQAQLLDAMSIAILGIVILGLAIAAIALEGRDNGAVRFLAYAAFAAEVLYLSYETIDSILGTSAFFLLSGLVVALLAFVVVRLEKRFSRRTAEVTP
ncbi:MULTISPECIES: DUF2157 domain-containing protein [Rhizobium]|uniref:DUF2157 domain-containing protein n=1 Tax=Rhizobium wuzhouense TaxID=1986026 RepID=A0ABX5NP14_9HYPH|nr:MULTISPECIES: DUF2157 domain-containing protein [Rhizobium]PYB71327.1 DUF2157 domain-containing protein [Rhizobium wuzhouense]RKE84924.1 putative membrane protein [Rhizobium sp. AG855]